MIQIGNQTAFSAETPLAPFEYAIAHGFDAFEWFPDKRPDGIGWDETDLDVTTRRRIRDTARASGMRLSVHARWQANPLRPDSQPLLLADVELAQDLGAELLNVHLHAEQGLNAYLAAITPLVQRTADAGLQLSIENTPLHTPDDFNALFAALGQADVPRDHVGMCLDLGHANLCAATRNNYLGFVDRLASHVPIIHLHLHENWGDADSHLPLFTGPSGRNDGGIRGFLERLRRRQYSGSMILEQWPQPPSLLDHARERLLNLLSETRPSKARSSTELPAAKPRLTTHSETESRPAENDFVSTLVAADERCRSWREKLDFVRELLAREHPPITTRQLVDVAIYLRFLGTGEISCEEDGSHYRPSHHARIALQIQKRLAALATPENAPVVRRIYPWLPSSAQTFQRAEPLTRIRDIAHRNDIPSDLKREIKHSLQNKLHRCAGPEDLATSAALLKRITAPGAKYSSDFVEQFRLFHTELKEFFNARSLEERLEALQTSRPDDADLIRQFLKAKTDAKVDEGVSPISGRTGDSPVPSGDSPDGTTPIAPTHTHKLRALRSLTELRRRWHGPLEKAPSATSQDLRLADLGLEDFAFVLLSQRINTLDAKAPAASWDCLLETLLLTVVNLALSRVGREECTAVENELRAWRKGFDPADREQALRLKATVDRGRRLAEDYSDRITALFLRRAEKLGHALGVPEHAIQVFCDAEIRGHLVFQLSKLVSILLKRIRAQLALPAWDVLVPGHAAGRLIAVESMEDLSRNLNEPVVALVRSAEGDEEIPRRVVGIVLGHEIPHLSHLGVRARQAGVVFVACEEASEFEELGRAQGKNVMLGATPEQVRWQPSSQAAPTRATLHRQPIRLPGVRLEARRSWLPVEEITAETGGGKAGGMKRLAELAHQAGAGFKTPPAWVVPFGVMETAWQADPKVEAEYGELLKRIRQMDEDKVSAVAEQLRNLVQGLDVPGAITTEASKVFRGSERLMVRSSANCEDLAELAGAGLFESVANVNPENIAKAVRAVWASLWTKRAAQSRQQAGIPHEQAHIAVLVQPMLEPDYSFILHTENPIQPRPRELYAEIAVGWGDILASAAVRGTPYRLLCNKDNGAVRTLAFASFSQALRTSPDGGMMPNPVDYSKVELSLSADARQKLGQRLAAIGRFVEEALGKPQDIEGAVVGNEIYLVQSRPQQGRTRNDGFLES